MLFKLEHVLKSQGVDRLTDADYIKFLERELLSPADSKAITEIRELIATEAGSSDVKLKAIEDIVNKF